MKKMSFVTFTEMLLQAGIVDQMRIDKMTKKMTEFDLVG